ncbi:MAG: STAS domain-containing protein [Proteobacteria bacterium]|nr:STAS domain-containing protein [Pseudomonadota bacterium]MBU4294830.1 STAS domain-containing protein [Pseudomonadota bacterium]
MEEFAVNQSNPADQPGTMVVSITGSMTIQYGAEIKSAFLEAMGSADTLLLDLSKVTEIDLVGLQFICSAHLTSIAGGKGFVVMKADNEVVAAAAYDAGFDRHVGCMQDRDHTCIWTGGDK